MSLGAVVAVLVIGIAAPGVWVAYPWLPFAVGLLAGLPHGALDHLVPWWGAGQGWSRRRLLRTATLMSAYVLLAVGTFALARLWPAPALVLLLAGSVVHFGVGESTVNDLRVDRRGPPGRWAGFGAAVVVGPFVAWPDQVRPVVDVLAPGASEPLLSAPALLGAAVATVAAVLVTSVQCLRVGRWTELGELVLLVTLVVVVPPLAAFGVYFGAWHGLRHLARLVRLAPANVPDLRAGRLLRPWRRVLAAAALPTGAVLAALVVLLALPGLFPHVVAGAVSAGLALVLALTVPHMIIVLMLDRRQRPTAPATGGTDGGP